jgi:hypothetical protein
MKSKIIILCLIVLAGCTMVNQPLTETQKKAILEEAQKTVSDLFNALAVIDVDKIISLSDTANPDCMIVTGDQVLKFDKSILKELSADFEKQTFETKAEKYIIIDAASFIYFWNGKNYMFMKSGDTIKLENFFASYIFKKEQEGWKFLYGHESNPAPAPDTAAVVSN